jgi:protein-disulfide isomerase
MKKTLKIFLRVIFVLLAMFAVAIFGWREVVLYQSRSAIESALVIGNMPVIGDKERPFTIVEFFDYRCPHCAPMSRLVDEALGDDTQAKIILRPVVFSGEDSFKVTSFVMAAEKQKAGAAVALHRAIMAMDSLPSFDGVRDIAKTQGIDVAKAESDSSAEDIKSAINQNIRLVRDIGFYSVPALVIGDKGYVPRNGVLPGVNELKLMILDAKTRLRVIK